jgi:hypothetical protein
VGEETIKPETIEQKVAMVSDWVKNISEKQEVGHIDAKILRDVLKNYGADFEHLKEEDKESLRGYSEKKAGPGVRAVWGNEIVDDYKSWIKNFISEYEENPNNRRLPELKPSGRKDSGMIQFLFEMTAFASGEISLETFKKYTEARVINGKLWSEHKGDERQRVKVPTNEEPILLSSFPPEFPIKALEWFRDRKAA